jgi:hypothetical protein
MSNPLQKNNETIMKKNVKSLTTLLISMTASLFLAQPLFAAEAEINWVNPEKYDDLRA